MVDQKQRLEFRLHQYETIVAQLREDDRRLYHPEGFFHGLANLLGNHASDHNQFIRELSDVEELLRLARRDLTEGDNFHNPMLSSAAARLHFAHGELENAQRLFSRYYERDAQAFTLADDIKALGAGGGAIATVACTLGAPVAITVGVIGGAALLLTGGAIFSNRHSIQPIDTNLFSLLGQLAWDGLHFNSDQGRRLYPGHSFFFRSLESYAHRNTLPEARRLQLENKWRELIEHCRTTMAEAGSDPHEQIRYIIDRIFTETEISRYSRDFEEIFGISLGTGGNCEAEMRLLLSVFSELNIRLPEGECWTIQRLTNHVQLIIYNKNSGDVWNPFSGEHTWKIATPLFSPSHIYYLFFERQGPRPSQRERDFVVAYPNVNASKENAPSPPIRASFFGSSGDFGTLADNEIPENTWIQPPRLEGDGYDDISSTDITSVSRLNPGSHAFQIAQTYFNLIDIPFCASYQTPLIFRTETLLNEFNSNGQPSQENVERLFQETINRAAHFLNTPEMHNVFDHPEMLSRPEIARAFLRQGIGPLRTLKSIVGNTSLIDMDTFKGLLRQKSELCDHLQNLDHWLHEHPEEVARMFENTTSENDRFILFEAIHSIKTISGELSFRRDTYSQNGTQFLNRIQVNALPSTPTSQPTNPGNNPPLLTSTQNTPFEVASGGELRPGPSGSITSISERTHLDLIFCVAIADAEESFTHWTETTSRSLERILQDPSIPYTERYFFAVRFYGNEATIRILRHYGFPLPRPLSELIDLNDTEEKRQQTGLRDYPDLQHLHSLIQELFPQMPS